MSRVFSNIAMPTIHMRNGEGGRRRGGREGNVTTINISSSSSSSSQSWIINTTVDPDPDHQQQGAQLIGQVRWAGQVASQRIGFRPQKKKGAVHRSNPQLDLGTPHLDSHNIWEAGKQCKAKGGKDGEELGAETMPSLRRSNTAHFGQPLTFQC